MPSLTPLVCRSVQLTSLCKVPTCFGSSLERLASLSASVRDTKQELFAKDKLLTAPRELLRLVEWMMTHALKTASHYLVALPFMHG